LFSQSLFPLLSLGCISSSPLLGSWLKTLAIDRLAREKFRFIKFNLTLF
jgi:hypothetical protein